MRGINKHRSKTQRVFAKTNGKKEEARLARLDARVAREAEGGKEAELKKIKEDE